MDTLQATHDFVSSYELPPTHLVGDSQAATELLAMIDEDLSLSSEDDVSLSTRSKFAPGFSSSVAKRSLVASNHDDESPDSSAKWPGAPRTQPRSRRRRVAPRKEEIAELKKQAAKLSDKLNALKASAAVLEAAAKHSSTENTLFKVLWKDAAARQLALRKKAEEDNAELRGEVVAQAKMASNLKRMLRRRYSEEMLELEPMTKRGRNWASVTLTSDDRVFSELLEGLDPIYAGFDDLLTAKGMATLSCPGRKDEAYPETTNGLFIELMRKSQVPFSAHLTGDAVWKSLCGRKTHCGDSVGAKMNVEDFQLAGNTMKSYRRYTCSTAGHSAIVQESRVGRKYEEDDRTVFVCSTLIESASRSLGAVGLLFRETIVVVVRKGTALASGGETAVVEHYWWVNRRDDGKKNTLLFREKAYTDIAIKGWDTKISLFNERIENALFDDARSLKVATCSA